jgi:polyphosphate kinase
MKLPFDGAISRFLKKDAPKAIRKIIVAADKDSVTDPDFPYAEELKRADYDRQMAALQIELVKLQSWVKSTGQRIAILFEGRDAAGKGGTIHALTENLNPRGARVVALAKPTETEAGQWYFQRYIKELPAKGEVVFFDRSWYNRGIVEQVFGWVTPEQRATWFDQVGPFEAMLKQDGVHLVKLWLDVHQATQLQRFLDRERDPLRQWKLSQIDIDGLHKWDAYSAAITETLTRTHGDVSPWSCIRADDKRRARLNAIRCLLHPLDYPGKTNVDAPDPKLVGPPATVCG